MLGKLLYFSKLLYKMKIAIVCSLGSYTSVTEIIYIRILAQYRRCSINTIYN